MSNDSEDGRLTPEHPGLHVAIIMDGSGRWATARGQPRSEGHRAGRAAVRRVVEAAPQCGIGTLTLYAFSSDNWRRPASEVSELMRIFESFFTVDVPPLVRRGLRVSVLGRRDRLPASLLEAIEKAEASSPRAGQLHVRMAIDYSGREAIVRAAHEFPQEGEASADAFTRRLAEVEQADLAVPDIDLLIRTGGEQRLSNCPLWEIAYAELYFTACLWPDFGAAELDAAVREFRTRDRRFGCVSEVVQP
jgi:undecaprenyl diphosphate synthase